MFAKIFKPWIKFAFIAIKKFDRNSIYHNANAVQNGNIECVKML